MTNPLEESDTPLEVKLSHAFARLGIVQRANSWESTSVEGLNPTQGSILSFLHKRNTSVRLSEIAQELAVSNATVSDSVSTLVEKGLVTKRRAKEDARATAISLRPKGKKLADRLGLGDIRIKQALESLGSNEREQLYRTMLKLIRQLQLAGQISVNRACVTCRYFRPNVHKTPSRPHHCVLVDAPFGDKTLREDCSEHEPADEHLAAQNWKTFAGENG